MGAVNSVAFTCDAAQLLGAGADKSLHLWDATSGARLCLPVAVCLPCVSFHQGAVSTVMWRIKWCV